MSLRSFATGLARVGGGLLTGGITGAIAGLLPRAGSSGGGTTMPSPLGFAGGGFNMPFRVTGPGGVPLPGFSGGTPAPCPRGFHLNKHPLAASKKHGAVGARQICVRNRSMNPLNWRAVSRSIRRVNRAEKLVRKIHRFAQPRQRRIAAQIIPHSHRITSGS